MTFIQRHKRLFAVLAILTTIIMVLFTFFGGDEEESLTLPGKVEARRLTLSFPTGERIDKMMVTEGDHVNKGDVLATLEAKQLIKSIAQSRQRIQEQEAIIRELEREIDHNKVQISTLNSQLKGLRADLILQERKLGQTVIFAPADGVVYSRLLEPGDIAEPHQPVYYLVVDGTKWIRAYVSEADLKRVIRGMPAKVDVDGLFTLPMEGQVKYISNVAEEHPKVTLSDELYDAKVYEVRVYVKDEQNELRMGVPATVTLQ